MEGKVLEFVKKHGLLQPGDTVIVALSGGADSVALFHFLWVHREQMQLRILAAHFEHGLRGGESVADLEFVDALCAEHGAKLFVGHGGMGRREKPRGKSVETWARDERYAFLERLAKEHGAKIATAHTQNDNAETVLFNAARGAGVRGLAGIPPARGCVVRPLLDVSRAEVEAYCEQNGLSWRVDATNFDERFSRNRIRNTVLPALEVAHSGAAQSLCRTAADMRILDDWLRGQALELLESAQCKKTAENANFVETRYDAACLRAAPQPVRLAALAALAGCEADRAALARMEQVLLGEVRGAQLPGGKEVSLRRGALVIADLPADALPERAEYQIPVRAGRFTFPGGFAATVEIAPWPDEQLYHKIITQKGLTFVADCAIIIDCGIFRTRREGDRFAPRGRGVTKTLKKLMSENGTGQRLRQSLPLIAQRGTNRVLFLWGVGFCEGTQPGETTWSVLVVTQE